MADIDPTLKSTTPGVSRFTEVLHTLKRAGFDVGDAFALFGLRGASAAVALTTMSDTFEELEAKTKNAEGAAKRMAAIMADNLRGDSLALKSAMEELVLQMGDQGLTGTMRGVIQAATGVARALGGISSPLDHTNESAFQLAQTVKILATVLGAYVLGRAIGFGINMLGKMMLSLAATRTALTATALTARGMATAMAVTPWGAAIAGVLALGAALYAISKQQTPINQFFDDLKGQLRDSRELMQQLENMSPLELVIALPRMEQKLEELQKARNLLLETMALTRVEEARAQAKVRPRPEREVYGLLGLGKVPNEAELTAGAKTEALEMQAAALRDLNAEIDKYLERVGLAKEEDADTKAKREAIAAIEKQARLQAEQIDTIEALQRDLAIMQAPEMPGLGIDVEGTREGLEALYELNDVLNKFGKESDAAAAAAALYEARIDALKEKFLEADLAASDWNAKQAEAQRLIEGLQTPLQQWIERKGELADMEKRQLITKEELIRLLEKEGRQYEKNARAKALSDERQAQKEKWAGAPEAIQDYVAQTGYIEDMGAAMDKISNQILPEFSSAISEAFAGWISGSKSAGEAFSDFGMRVIQILIEVVVQLAITKIAMKALGMSTQNTLGFMKEIQGMGGTNWETWVGIGLQAASVGTSIYSAFSAPASAATASGGGGGPVSVGGSTAVPVQHGAIVLPTARGTLVRAAEAGEAEAIVPLSRAAEFGFGRKGGDRPITINIDSGDITVEGGEKGDMTEEDAAMLGKMLRAEMEVTARKVITREMQNGGLMTPRERV
jgi:hypothetical protein